MTIDKAIKEIESITVVADEKQALAFALAVHTMKKYQMFQAEYVERLKADMVAMLTEIQLEIEEKYPKCDLCEYFVDYDYDENDISEYRSVGSITDITDLIQQKINSLKEKS